MDRFLVIHKYTCPICKGERFFYSELWQDANAAFDGVWEEYYKKSEPGPGEDAQELYYKAGEKACGAMDSYWIEHGYNPRGKLPPEEEPCGECMGEGIICREVDLTEALESLGLVVKRETGGSHE